MQPAKRPSKPSVKFMKFMHPVERNIIENKINNLEITKTNPINKGPYLLITLLNDKNENKNDAINDIYKVLRPGEPPTIEIASQIFNNLFFSSDRYDLSDVGRVKMNSRLNINCSDKNYNST